MTEVVVDEMFVAVDTQPEVTRNTGLGGRVLRAVFETEPWREQALCAQTDPEIFFPEVGRLPAAVRRICASCVVRVECLDYALVNNEQFGVWGGLTDRERNRLKKELN